MKPRVAVALSGGVDSAVAAARLLDAGYEVIALHGKEWSGGWAGSCPAADDAEAARSVAAFLGIPLTLVNCERAYREQVFADFLTGIESGLTPNPDVACNRQIKFGFLAAVAKKIGAQAMATGHYARIISTGDSTRLFVALDPRKDQSYFLCTLTAEQLAFARFPLGRSTKVAVRAEARSRRLPVAERPESMGLCFVGTERFPAFLRAFVPKRNGQIVDETGSELGQHPGIAQYTLGQRHGLGLSGGPFYVAAKDARTETLTVVRDRTHPRLLSSGVRLTSMHWTHTPSKSPNVMVRFRHQQRLAPATLNAAGESVTIRFREPAWAATPGQVLAVYHGDEVLGGGPIAEVYP